MCDRSLRGLRNDERCDEGGGWGGKGRGEKKKMHRHCRSDQLQQRKRIQSALIYLSFATFLLNPARSRRTAYSSSNSSYKLFFLNESHMTLRQKSWYVTQNLLINAHFIIPWPPGCSSQGGFDPFLRLKKIKSASHLNISVQKLSCALYIGDIPQLPGLFANSGLSDEVRFARTKWTAIIHH